MGNTSSAVDEEKLNLYVDVDDDAISLDIYEVTDNIEEQSAKKLLFFNRDLPECRGNGRDKFKSFLSNVLNYSKPRIRESEQTAPLINNRKSSANDQDYYEVSPKESKKNHEGEEIDQGPEQDRNNLTPSYQSSGRHLHRYP